MGYDRRRADRAGGRDAMKKKLSLIILFSVLCLIPGKNAEATEDAYAPQGSMWRKLERGGTNLLLGSLEFPRNLLQQDKYGVIPTWMVGIGKGLYRSGERMLVGIYEVITFPVPLPEDYLPVLEPEFVWNHPNRTLPTEWEHNRVNPEFYQQ